jgi:HNH endonuclease
MKTLPTQDYLLSILTYDKETGNLTRNGSVVGIPNKNGYKVIRIDMILYYQHRIIYKMIHNQEPDSIDHINMDKSDNRIENLRSCTMSQNHMNRPAYSSNKLGIKGVIKVGNRYKASICKNRESYYLGYFDTPELAHNAYIKKAIEIFGEFYRP